MSSSENPDLTQTDTAPGQKDNAPPKRRGPKGYYTGLRKVYLESHIPEYRATKKGNRMDFWHRLRTGWWTRFPWKLNDDEEPPAGDVDEMTRLGSVAPGEQTKKGEVESLIHDRLSRWFVNHATKKTAPGGSLGWLPLLQRLHQVRNPRPRQRTTVQQFMLDHTDIVNAAFVSRYADGAVFNSNLDRLNAKYALAKTMLSGHYSHLARELDKKAVVQHNTAIAEWGLILDDISLAQDVSRARDTLFDAVHPLLQAIGSYVGCHVSLIAGSAEKEGIDDGFFTAVHWWPGDRKSKDWTQWDEDAFRSGVAAPFLRYAGSAGKVSLAANANPPVPPTLLKPIPATNNVQPTSGLPALVTPPTITTTTTAASQAGYRSLPAKKTSTEPTQGAGKRKYRAKPRPVQYFEDTASEDENPGNGDGDGSSSGDSVHSDAAAPAKRQRISRVTTRSSTRTVTPNEGTSGAPHSPSPSPATMAQLFPIPPNIDSSDPVEGLSSDAGTMSIIPSDLEPTNASAGTMGSPLGGNITYTNNKTSAGVGEVPLPSTDDVGIPSVTNTATKPTTDTDFDLATVIELATDAEVPATSNDIEHADPGNPPVTDAKITGGNAEPPVKATSTLFSSSTTPTITPPFSALPDVINEAIVPGFLLQHGKGKRQVNIFRYLNEVEDPHFRQVLLRYIHFEINAGVGGSLPTSGRPVEISNWTSRARPFMIHDYTKGKRSFSAFVDSVIVWWGSIQPSWRSFERGEVSRGVHGEWDALCASRINGLLNVVMLVYWWARVLKEQCVGDSTRADYENFADDVAWVLSNLST